MSDIEIGFTDGNPSFGTCERCGAENEDLRHGGCFVCGMLEDPESTVDEVDDGVEALRERGGTVEAWETARTMHDFEIAPEVLAVALRAEQGWHRRREAHRWWRRAWRKIAAPAAILGFAVPLVLLLRLLGLGWWMAAVGGIAAVLYHQAIGMEYLRRVRRTGDAAGTMIRELGVPCDLCGDTREVTIACSCGHKAHAPCPVCRTRETRKSIFPMAHGQA